MEKIVGFDIGESSVKLEDFAGADLKKAVTAELPEVDGLRFEDFVHGRHGGLPAPDGQK